MKRSRIIVFVLLAGILAGSSAFAESAEDAWHNLVGEKFMKRPEFIFVQQDPALPNVLIYGDSISMGYTTRVRENLKGKANVYRIHCNGGDTSDVIPNMQKMQAAMGEHWSFKWDVIHFNAGLHDLKYLDRNGKYDTKNGTQVRSPEAYAKNLKAIFAYFRKIAPDAKIIFATTTPVPENPSGRKAGDAVRFNRAALDVLKEYPEIAIDDLYAFTKPNFARWQASPGNVHYNWKGRHAQGDQVASVILKAIPATEKQTPWTFVSMPDFLNVDTTYPQPGWEDSLDYILKSVKAENPDFLLVPGDLVMGHWHNNDTKGGAAGIRHFASVYYPAWKARMKDHSLTWYAALGDHEIGDNPWDYEGALDNVAAYKHEFSTRIGMPLNGPDHLKGTAFWWKHKNVLFASVDVFEPGESSQGLIRTGVTGKQLEWLENVISSNKDVNHIVVMGHAPCLGPVRKWSSSGLMVEGGRASPFWQAMAKHGISLYLCGEVHAITCTERDGVLQIAHGGLIGYNTRTNYLVVKVYPDRLELEIKEIDMILNGKELWQPGKNRPLEKVEISPQARENGFITVGKAAVMHKADQRTLTDRQGYFLKKFETSKDYATAAHRNKTSRPTELPRIRLDGSVTQ